MRNKIFILIFISTLCFGQGFKKHWIYFIDKGIDVNEKTVLSKNSAAFLAAKSELSEKAIQRRMKVMDPDKIIDYSDLPVYTKYINELERLGIKIENKLKWFNAVTAYLSDKDIESIRQFKFIKEIKPVSIFRRKNDPIETALIKKDNVILSDEKHQLSYGKSLFQLEMINVPKVHDLGIFGTDIIVGMLDSGFRWKTHNSLKTRNVLLEHDFVFNDDVTANESNDIYSQDNHGTLTFSVLGGYLPDTLIGPAFDSKFILAKTEDVRSETRIEEDNWAAAIEWMEGFGVDVTSTSLGYNDFDGNIGNYSYKDMDGNTTVITKAADMAVTRGVVVVNSAGNEGNSAWKYITAPADGKYVIAVGAATSTGVKASFSSVGPTYDKRIKPDVSALGSGVWGANTGTTNGIATASGTSLSCPLVGGAAALILSARPDLTPAQVRDALRNTASKSLSPDTLLGWGIIDAYKALLYHGLVFSNRPVVVKNKNTIDISTFIASKYPINQQSFKIYYSLNDGASFTSASMIPDSIFDSNNSGRYRISIQSSNFNKINFYFSASDNSGERKDPYTSQSQAQKTYKYDINTNIETEVNEFSLSQNYPNPFNPLTNIKVSILEVTRFSLEIYNLLGERVIKLFDGIKLPGNYYFTWNGKNSEGINLPGGVYYYKIKSDKFTQTKKMIFIK